MVATILAQRPHVGLDLLDPSPDLIFLEPLPTRLCSAVEWRNSATMLTAATAIAEHFADKWRGRL
jgi:hypothetical protein